MINNIKCQDTVTIKRNFERSTGLTMSDKEIDNLRKSLDVNKFINAPKLDKKHKNIIDGIGNTKF